MDWKGTSSEALQTVELAVIKVEATVPITDRTYGGAVVLNPGETTLCFDAELIDLAQMLRYSFRRPWRLWRGPSTPRMVCSQNTSIRWARCREQYRDGTICLSQHLNLSLCCFVNKLLTATSTST
jgi:hypothetical protein